jgi:hypothetical protein
MYHVLRMIYLTILCSSYRSVAGSYEDNESKIICKEATVVNSEVLHELYICLDGLKKF